jgi:hypothetical protein
MKRRSKKILISNPSGLNSTEIDDLNEGDLGSWETSVSGLRERHVKSLRKKAHNLSSIHLKHFHKHSR